MNLASLLTYRSQELHMLRLAIFIGIPGVRLKAFLNIFIEPRGCGRFRSPLALLSWPISSLLTNYKKRQRVVVSHGYICSPVPWSPIYLMAFYDSPTGTQDFFDCSSRLIRNGLFDATFTHKITCVQPKRRNNVKDDCYKLAVKFLRWHVL